MPKAYIIGLGRSGIAAAKLLKQQGWEVLLSDRADNESLRTQKAELGNEGICVELGTEPPLNEPERPDLIAVSPGVPWDVPLLQKARVQGIDTIGELELAWRYLNDAPWVGITGTNGKTTTTALASAIFQQSGLNAPACGNIGFAACELALQESSIMPSSQKKTTYDWIIAEISSYQIESSLQLAPKIGIWTTLTADHLSRHQTLENYANIKSSLLKRCSQPILNGDDPYLRGLANQWPNAYWTSVKGKTDLIGDRAHGIYLEDNWVVAFGELILPINLFKMVGAHNQQNLLLAVGAARLAGIDKQSIAEAIAAFNGVPHRLERIGTLDGIDWINDSKATNYDAAVVGLGAVEGPVILIAGGQAKTGDAKLWIDSIKGKAANVLLIGEAAPTFAEQLQTADYSSWEIVEKMENAVERSLELAKQQQAKAVLLSPACASFDQYPSFEHRGNHFRSLFQLL